MKHIEKRQAGQSIVIIVIALVAFAALAAIVVDVGNSYVQQRQVQNAADAASMAGSLALAQKQSYGGIADAITKYLQTNGITNLAGITGWFVVQDSNGNTHILNGAGDKPVFPKGQYTNDYVPPEKMSYQGTPMTVVGTYVDASKQLNTFFAASFGIKQVQVKANSMGHVSTGACSATNVLPIGIDANTTFPINPVSGLHTIVYKEDSPNTVYTLLENKKISNGHGGYTIEYHNIGYLTWPWDPSNGDTTADPTLKNNISDPSRSGEVGINGTTYPFYAGSAGNMATTSVKNAILTYKAGDAVILPVYDNQPGYGSTAQYHIIGFASFDITDVQVSGNGLADDRKILGKFQKWVDPQASGGCTDFGVGSEKQGGDSQTKKRKLAGSVTFIPMLSDTPPYTTSADVAFVLDTSGSMADTFGNGDNTTKISAARSAMSTFIDNLKTGNTTLGYNHQVGYVNFPQNFQGSNHTQTCQKFKEPDGSYVYWDWTVSAQVYSNMSTWDPMGTTFATVKSHISSNTTPSGGTPLAQGIKAGTQILLGSGRDPDNIPVMILASDGMPNVTSADGKTTGWYGSMSNTNVKLGKNPDGTNTYPDCDKGAVTDAYTAANTAKSSGVVVFAIGTGGDYDPNVLKAMSTPDSTGQQHYFTAANSNALTAAYNSISNQVGHLGCTPLPQSPKGAAGAKVSIKKVGGAQLADVTTYPNGEFIVDGEVDPGQYQVTAIQFYDPVTKLWYNNPTDYAGGIDVTDPIIFVDDGKDTYRTTIYVKTDSNPCN